MNIVSDPIFTTQDIGPQYFCHTSAAVIIYRVLSKLRGMMAVLNKQDLSQAQEIIDQVRPGIYELKHLYGSKWEAISSPTVFGGNFKETVQAGHLRKIRLLSPKTNNHQTYEVYSS